MYRRLRILAPFVLWFATALAKELFDERVRRLEEAERVRRCRRRFRRSPTLERLHG